MAPPAFPAPSVMDEWSEHLLLSLLSHVRSHFQSAGRVAGSLGLMEPGVLMPSVQREGNR